MFERSSEQKIMLNMFENVFKSPEFMLREDLPGATTILKHLLAAADISSDSPGP
jgi:hypothetical protein